MIFVFWNFSIKMSCKMLPADPPAWCIVKDVLYLLAVCSTSTPAIPGRRLFFVFALILGIFSGMLLFPRQINDVMLNGESVLITGASQGLGEEIAYSYARRGASLVITARSEDNLKKVSQRCVQMGAPQVFIYPADMTKSRDIENLIQFSTSKLGKISHLVLNHASQSTPDWWTGSVANETSLRNMFEANFFAYQTMASKFLNEFGEIDGRILVISSVIGVLPMPFYIPYAATKHALQGFFGGLQHELYMKGSPRKITLALIGRTDTETQRTLTEGGNFVRHGRFPPAANVGETAEKLVRSSLNGEWVVYHPITSKYINILTNLPIIQPIFRRIIAYQMEKKGC